MAGISFVSFRALNNEHQVLNRTLSDYRHEDGPSKSKNNEIDQPITDPLFPTSGNIYIYIYIHLT